MQKKYSNLKTTVQHTQEAKFASQHKYRHKAANCDTANSSRGVETVELSHCLVIVYLAKTCACQYTECLCFNNKTAS